MFKTNKSKGGELGSNARNKRSHINMQTMFYISVFKSRSFSRNQRNLRQNIPIWFFRHQDAKIWHKQNIECNMWMHVVQLYTCMEPHDKGKNFRLIWGYVKKIIIEYNAYFKNNIQTLWCHLC